MSDSATQTEVDLELLAEGLETGMDAWDSLDEEQQAEVVGAVTAAWEDEGGPLPGNETQSEFQRQAKSWANVSKAMGKAAVLFPAGAIVFLALKVAFLALSMLANKLTPEKTKAVAAWLHERVPGAYKKLCKNPWLLVGVALVSGSATTAVKVTMDLAAGEVFYLLSSCPAWEDPDAPDGPRAMEVPGVSMEGVSPAVSTAELAAMLDAQERTGPSPWVWAAAAGVGFLILKGR